jgi:hypothetical protein
MIRLFFFCSFSFCLEIELTIFLIPRSVAKEGGWMGFKQFKISVMKRETSNMDSEITTYTLVPVDGQPLPPFRYVFVSILFATGASSSSFFFFFFLWLQGGSPGCGSFLLLFLLFPVSRLSPGSYISIRMKNVGDAESHMRTYSLADVCNQKSFTISVKTEKAKPVTHNNKTYTPPGIIL